jgi:hypothetical protein
VATELSREEIRRLAELGAERRLQELRKEEAAIRAAFPDLGAAPAARGRRGRPRKADTETARKAAATRRRPKMSAAARRAVSERMKKYWAARRKANG